MSLKPYPFCGSLPNCYQTARTRTHLSERVNMDLKPCPFRGSYYVIPAGGRMICDACYAFGPTQRDDPFAAWNRRASDPRSVELARAVRAVRFNCPPDDVWFDKLTDAESLADAILREAGEVEKT